MFKSNETTSPYLCTNWSPSNAIQLLYVNLTVIKHAP